MTFLVPWAYRRHRKFYASVLLHSSSAASAASEDAGSRYEIFHSVVSFFEVRVPKFWSASCSSRSLPNCLFTSVWPAVAKHGFQHKRSIFFSCHFCSQKYPHRHVTKCFSLFGDFNAIWILLPRSKNIITIRAASAEELSTVVNVVNEAFMANAFFKKEGYRDRTSIDKAKACPRPCLLCRCREFKKCCFPLKSLVSMLNEKMSIWLTWLACAMEPV